MRATTSPSQDRRPRRAGQALKSDETEAFNPEGGGREKTGKRPVRRALVACCTADEFVLNLRLLYRRECDLRAPSICWLHRKSDVPYETLRGFLKGDILMLCAVNEEKLARALGHHSSFFRRLLDRWQDCVVRGLRLLSGRVRRPKKH